MSPIIKSRFVHLTEPGGAAGADAPRAALPAAARARGRCEKRVELLREGERVHALEITCSCGEVTLIELDYPEDGPDGAAS